MLDDNGQPVNRRLGAARLAERGVDELIGLCKGVLADGAIVTPEAGFLLSWMDANRAAADLWPASVLYPRIAAAMADGVVDEAEQAELLDVLVKITGAPTHNINEHSASTLLPFDDPEPDLVFEGAVFCVTGQFVFAPRKHVVVEIEARGGIVKPKPIKSTRYLVVGEVGSKDWLHSTFGRKIEAAMALKAGGVDLCIVSEQHWASCL